MICGNPYNVVPLEHSVYEKCGVFSKQASILVTVPVSCVIISMIVTLYLLQIIINFTAVQYEVEWKKDVVLEYLRVFISHMESGDFLVDMHSGNDITLQKEEEVEKPYLPVSVSYMHARLRAHWPTSIVNIVWALANFIVVLLGLVLDKRSGEYWHYIGICFSSIAALHVTLVLFINFYIVPSLYASGLGRNIFENINKYGARIKKHGKTRELFYLDQYEQISAPPVDLNQRERALFVKSYNDAVGASKAVKEAQSALMQGAGSSAIGIVLLGIGSVKELDVNGTTPSINALALTFTIAALAQAVSSYAFMMEARTTSVAATSGIQCINKCKNDNTWYLDVYKEVNRGGWIGLNKEKNVDQIKLLDPNYYLDKKVFVDTSGNNPTESDSSINISNIAKADTGGVTSSSVVVITEEGAKNMFERCQRYFTRQSAPARCGSPAVTWLVDARQTQSLHHAPAEPRYE